MPLRVQASEISEPLKFEQFEHFELQPVTGPSEPSEPKDKDWPHESEVGHNPSRESGASLRAGTEEDGGDQGDQADPGELSPAQTEEELVLGTKRLDSLDRCGAEELRTFENFENADPGATVGVFKSTKIALQAHTCEYLGNEPAQE